MRKEEVNAGQMELPIEQNGQQKFFYDIDVSPSLERKGVSLVKEGTMYESLRYAEYEISSGLGEIVDNAVEAEANNIHILTKTINSKSKNSKKSTEVMDEIAVIDDGKGMDYNVISRALILGDSPRPRKKGGLGIGRFGVGLTLGGISLARRLELYSRDKKDGEFYHTYLDLDAIKDPEKAYIPYPVYKEPPAEYSEFIANGTGTIIILKKCDRLQYDQINDKALSADQQTKGLSSYIGRTFRKFIYGGINITVNEEKVYLHDPLYRLGPTRFEVDPKSLEDPKTKMKARLWGKTVKIPIEIQDKPGEFADVEITMTLLPKEWRIKDQSGGSKFATDRKIHENEGFSILRANREVLYGHVPYIIGKRGQARSLDIDRWWGCEISFPPELDNYFHVRYIKRGAEPVTALRDKIKDVISESVKSLREEIKRDRREQKRIEAKKSGVFAGAEEAMAKADKIMAKGRRGSGVSPEAANKEFDKLAASASKTGVEDKTVEERRKELEEKPYSIVPVEYPESIFFETKHLLGHIVVNLNVNHPFYKEIFEPLCGSVETMDEQSDIYEGTKSVEQQKIRRAFMLLLLSYAKSESFFDNNDTVLSQLRSQWGLALGVAINSLAEREQL